MHGDRTEPVLVQSTLDPGQRDGGQVVGDPNSPGEELGGKGWTLLFIVTVATVCLV